MSDDKDWEGMWSAGGGLQPGQAFDATRCEPSFQALIDAGGLPTGRALVPGCGRGYAVAALASEDRAVTGLEISETAKAAADAHLRGVGCTAGKVIVDDFFTHEPDQPYDLAFDSTFLCAIPPRRREEWAARYAKLIRPGGELVYLHPILSRLSLGEFQRRSRRIITKRRAGESVRAKRLILALPPQNSAQVQFQFPRSHTLVCLG